MIAFEEEQPDVAERYARDALELAETRGFEALNRLGVALLPLGRVLAGRGELAEADGLLTRTLERMRAYREGLLIADCLLALAPVRRALGAPEEARELLAEAASIVEASEDPGIIGGRLEETRLILRRPARRVHERDELTDRELDVLRLLDEGLTKRDVGRTLFLSYNTIHSHTKSIYRKLDATSRDEALARARDLELI